MKQILIIDDFFGREMPHGRHVERDSLCRRLRLGGQSKKQPPEFIPLAEATFHRGQKPQKAAIGDVVENDLAGTLDCIQRGNRDGLPWDLIILDLCFYTGEVTEASDADFPGFPEGRPEDDDPDHFFGIKVLEECQRRCLNIPIVVFSAHSGVDIMSKVQDMGARGFVPRDARDADKILAEVLQTLDTSDNSSQPSEVLVDVQALLHLAKRLPVPSTAELRNCLPALKELHAVLLQRALRGALTRHCNAKDGVSLLPSIKLLTGSDEMTTSQAADWIKRLVHQTKPFESVLLDDAIVLEAYNKSVKLRSGAGQKGNGHD